VTVRGTVQSMYTISTWWVTVHQCPCCTGIGFDHTAYWQSDQLSGQFIDPLHRAKTLGALRGLPFDADPGAHAS
jgi:hypothetical protein